MRILHVTDCYSPRLGGLEVQVHQLSQQQRAAGHQVAILTATGETPGAHGRSVTRDHGVPVFRMAARMPGRLPVHPWPWAHARDLLTRLEPDVIHLHIGGLTPSTQAVAALAAAQERPAVLTVHSVWREQTTVRPYAVLDRLIGWSQWPIHLTAVSHLAADRVRRAAGGDREIAVLRNGVDVDEWRQAAVPRAGGPVHVVSAGRFAPRKRMMPLLAVLESAARILGPQTPLRVTVPGEGPELAAAREFVAERGIEDRLHLPGRLSREELVALYREADVYVAPGVDDAFSVAVQEAQAAGLAIVSRSQSGAAELIEEGVTGLLAADDDALAHAVVRLVTDSDLLARITAHNRQVPPETAWPRVLTETMAAYEHALTLVP